METKKNEVFKEKDVLGQEKPEGQLKHLKKRTDNWALILSVIILVIVAAILFYYKM